MKKEIVVIGLALAGASASSARGLVVSSEDDLSVVRRAVSQASAGGSSSDVDVEARSEKRTGARGQWFKVRVTEKRRGTKISIDLPLNLVRGLGADMPLRGDCKERGHRGHGHIRLGDVLDALESGQDVVKIDAEGATIRVFVE